MREFFEKQLSLLHLETGLQQLSKLSDLEYTDLLDILCAECAKFPLIPDQVKQESIQEFMKTDPEFIGFNRRIIWKWLNVVNRKYLPVDQSRYTEDPNHKPAAPEIAEMYLEQWKTELAKVGNPQAAQPEGIKDHRVALMKEQFGRIECKHTGLRVPISDTIEVCNDCGEELNK